TGFDYNLLMQQPATHLKSMYNAALNALVLTVETQANGHALGRSDLSAVPKR
ncbi:hypothetical protein JOB18_028585, partial [Solea senegalensis]